MQKRDKCLLEMCSKQIRAKTSLNRLERSVWWESLSAVSAVKISSFEHSGSIFFSSIELVKKMEFLSVFHMRVEP